MAVAMQEPALDFPRDVRVVVGNRTNVSFELFWDSMPYEFPAGEATTIDPEIAWALFAFETRVNYDAGQTPFRNFETGNEGERHQKSYYKARLVSMGIADDPEKKDAFKNLEFKVSRARKKVALKDFDSIK